MSAHPSMRPEPSPRRGFTMVGETPIAAAGPVVVQVDDSAGSVRALMAAAEQAMARSTELIVVTPLLGGVDETLMATLDDRALSSVQAILKSPRVTFHLVEESHLGFEGITDHCIERKACLLVLTRTVAERLVTAGGPLEGIMARHCDLLMVSDVHEDGVAEDLDQSSASSATNFEGSRRRSQDR